MKLDAKKDDGMLEDYECYIDVWETLTQCALSKRFLRLAGIYMNQCWKQMLYIARSKHPIQK